MVTFNGRITLPSHVRKQLGIKTGDSVEFIEVENGRFAISCRNGLAPFSSLRASELPECPVEPEEAS